MTKTANDRSYLKLKVAQHPEVMEQIRTHNEKNGKRSHSLAGFFEYLFMEQHNLTPAEYVNNNVPSVVDYLQTITTTTQQSKTKKRNQLIEEQNTAFYKKDYVEAERIGKLLMALENIEL